MAGIVFKGRLDVFSIRGKTCLRHCGRKGDLCRLGADEYFSFSLFLENSADHVFAWEEAYVRIDGGAPRHWGKGQIQASKTGLFHVAYRNMKEYMAPGTHTAVWYFDGRAVHKERFILTKNMKWEQVFPIPSEEEIKRFQNPHKRRSPYIAAWLEIPPGTRYTEYRIDFRASHLPKGTYCCLGNWAMDLSCLEKQYRSVRTEYVGINAYAGFQRIASGQTVSILSFWDVYCKDAFGKEITLRAKRIYPKAVVGADVFGGEGVGARSLVPFYWETDHWYRMHLKCVAASGKTLVEQWVYDMETGASTLLCSYDTGIADTAFQGDMAVFLENFLPETAGQVRSMEVCNAEYLDAATKQWQKISSARISSLDGAPEYEGSYNFGVSGNRLWMITSGVGGDWFHNGKGKKAMSVTLEDA